MSNKNKKARQSNKTPLTRTQEILGIIGGIASSLMAIIGVIKTFRDDVNGFTWLIIVGLMIWLIILWQMFQGRRVYAYVLLALSLAGGATGWLGWQSRTQATEDKVIVLVAKFDGPEDTYGLRDEMIEQLRETTKGYDDTEIVAAQELVTVAQGSGYARELGGKYKADLVIWAWYKPTEDPNITIHIENLSTTEIGFLQESQTYQPQATLDGLRSFQIQRKLGSATSTLISFLTSILNFNVGRYPVAVERLEQILNADDLSTYIDPETLYLYAGLLYNESGDFEKSIWSYDKALNLNPNEASAYNNRGMALYSLGRYEPAIQDYSKAIELKPDEASGYGNRGLAYFYLGNYEAAIKDYDKALELSPNNAMVYNDRGAAYNHLDQYERAIQDYSKSIELEPNQAIAYDNRGSTYYAIRQYELAISDFNMAIEIDPDRADTYNKRGLARSNLGRDEEAIKDFDLAIELNPDHAAAYHNRGVSYWRLKQTKRALEDYNKAIALNLDLAVAYNNRGLAYANLGDFNRAIQDYDKALTMDPNLAIAYNNRGSAYENLGRMQEAEADYQKFKELTQQNTP